MRAVTLASLSSLLAAVLWIGCSASPTIDFTGPGTGSTGATGSGAGAGTGGAGAGSSGSGSSGTGGIGLGGSFTSGVGSGGSIGGGCTKAAELVYVFDNNNVIHSFDPQNKTFKEIATANCASSPNSMAIDRNLVAWLNFVGSIYTFDLKTGGPCKKVIDLNQYPGFEQVGMGFATDTAGGTSETLYIDGVSSGLGLAKIDMNNLGVVPIGAFSGDSNIQGQSCELTGTGDARLFGYFTTSPYVRVAQLDKTNANIISDNQLNGFAPPSDWAFSFWGGDFYLYAYPVDQQPNATGSTVIHYSPSTGAVDFGFIPDAGFTIIGAGVSTCAPVTPPT